MTNGTRGPFVNGVLARFAEEHEGLPGAALPWLRRVRSDAIGRFAELGLPTTRHEDWKYTSVAAIERRAFDTPFDASSNGLAERALARHALDGTHRLVFVDGRYAPGLSRLDTLPAGAQVGSLAAAIAARPDRLEDLFVADDEAPANGFTTLNSALWADGAWIDLAPGVVLDMPIHLLFITTRNDLASFPRNLVRAGAEAGVTLIEHHAGPDDASYFTDAVTRIVLGKGARVAHAKLQQEGRRSFHIAAIHAEQAQDSRFGSHAFAFGGQLARSEIATRLGAEDCEAKLVGLYVGSGRQHIDHHTCIDHAQPRGTSREVYKGVLDGAARAVFNGRVIVRPDAQQTDAQQSNRNLLLSDSAEVDTKPQLEIWADDVKCAHGATVGQLDADQLHYLRSRGIDEAAARSLLIRAFAADTLEGIEHAALRARLESLLPGGLPEAA
ncbi:Fe-S cluster assembly protein SufD [Aromatoleum diolicum]|uniref:Fe-S cluster assembly protein SufD n=1 Tax=Aromatoleum diolicum TaxID=75796 RepID=A0ABX1QI90_9RHOO|nr:Fe-S cluster assembly protein SufD [Aromatoleum diolicum]NMG76949.1 Fe-S cluster assembly protein SufD [Aromatoleum diolicum]